MILIGISTNHPKNIWLFKADVIVEAAIQYMKCVCVFLPIHNSPIGVSLPCGITPDLLVAIHAVVGAIARMLQPVQLAFVIASTQRCSGWVMMTIRE